MKNIMISIIGGIIVTLLCSFTNISDDELKSQGVSQEQLEYLKQDVVMGKTGMIPFSECHASLEVPEGFVFLDSKQSKKLLVDYWNNPESRMSNVLGTLIPKGAKAFYQISVAYVISYDNCGYIKDDDANSIDYDELLKQLQQECKNENDSLPKEQRMWLTGWAVPPQYISSSHTLIWAKSFSSEAGVVVNYDMRVLGKDGLISVNAVISNTDIEEVKELQDLIVNSIQYNNGFKYSDFDETRDKVSDWTIGGLIAGGVLAKTGFFSKIGILLLKMWKIVVIGLIGIGAAIRKIFKKNED